MKQLSINREDLNKFRDLADTQMLLRASLKTIDYNCFEVLQHESDVRNMLEERNIQYKIEEK